MTTLEEIKKIRGSLEAKEIGAWTPDQLSRAMTKLALLNMNLGEMVVEAYGEYMDSEARRKVGMAQMELELSNDHSATRARTMTEAKSFELRDQENKAQYRYKLLQTAYRDTESLVSVLQSRLRQLGNELWEQKNNLEQEG